MAITYLISLQDEITVLRQYLVKQPGPSTAEPVTLPPALLSVLLPHIDAAAGATAGGSTTTVTAALTQRTRVLQEENDELYELLKHSETGKLKDEVRGLRRVVAKLEGALKGPSPSPIRVPPVADTKKLLLRVAQGHRLAVVRAAPLCPSCAYQPPYAGPSSTRHTRRSRALRARSRTRRSPRRTRTRRTTHTVLRCRPKAAAAAAPTSHRRQSRARTSARGCPSHRRHRLPPLHRASRPRSRRSRRDTTTAAAAARMGRAGNTRATVGGTRRP